MDVVSKNGVYLLSIPLKADGTIDDKEKKNVDGISRWFQINGEAIYNTEPYVLFGEGSMASKASGKKLTSLKCTRRDIRFTQKGNCVYAFCLKAHGGMIRIHSLAPERERIKDVRVLGCGSCKWQFTDDCLEIRYHPTLELCSQAVHAVKITFKKQLH